MNKKNTITLRLTDDQLAWLGALSRRSKRSKSEVIRSLIERVGTRTYHLRPLAYHPSVDWRRH